MENLRKVISLNQASKISGYHQDYLSSLIRKKEIEGEKLGGNWFTTEEEIKNYIFKQKIRHKKWIIKYFLYFKKVNKGFVYAFICLALLAVGIYFYNQKYSAIQIQTQTQAEIKETVEEINRNELQF